MKHPVIFLFGLAVMAFLFTVVGLLSLAGLVNAEVIFWSRPPIESDGGKILWIVTSLGLFLFFISMAIRKYRKTR